MNRLTNQEFESYIAGLGLAFQQQRLPKSLAYRPVHGATHGWAVPAASRKCLGLVGWALEGLAPWSSCVLWPFAGRWPEEVWVPSGCGSTTWRLFLQWAGIPDGWEGAIRMTRDQADIVKAVAFTFAAFGSSSQDDLFVIPDHGQQFIHIDPWNSDPRDEELALPAVKVHFASMALAEQFAGHMARGTYGPPQPTDSGSPSGPGRRVGLIGDDGGPTGEQ
jgi:hypothetical protein